MQISLGGIGLGVGGLIWLIRFLSRQSSKPNPLGPLGEFIPKNGANGTGVIDPRFKAHYEQFIRPQVEEFETRRVAALAEMRKRLFIIGGIGIVILAIGASISSVSFIADHLGGMLVVGAIAGMTWAAWPVYAYKDTIKEKIFSHVFTFYGQEWSYAPKGLGDTDALDISDFSGKTLRENWKMVRTKALEQNASSPTEWVSSSSMADVMQPYMGYGILPSHEQASTSDLIRGSYKAVPLTLLQCVLSSESGSGKDRHTTIHFHGLVIELSVPKRFTGHTAVRRDRGKMGNWLGQKFSGTMQTVRLEDPRFEKRYEVYGTDQVEARYLLTNSFMERLVALEDLFTAANGNCAIQCAFKDEKLLVTIPTGKEWFSTGSVFKPANFIDEINLVLQEMDQLFAITDVLKLDDRSGL